MNAERFAQIERIFQQAMDLEPGARADFIAREAGSDTALRAEVEGLVHAADSGPLLLDTSLLSSPPAPPAADGMLPRRYIGPYKLLREIGRGGMGTVYEAEQSMPQRRVALKVVHTGGDGRGAQLLHEPRILGRLNHPFVASIYDANETEDGLAYFVMELIEGQRLDEYIKEHALTRRERLALFCKICEAIQHAHMKSVIHLDLKPSNILVLPPQEARRELTIKVVDFGVAAVTGGDTTMPTAANTAGGMAGTLAYMSPEQRHGERDALDVRSDVYALGVILFKLMTGSLPYPVENVTFPEAWRILAQQQPLRPRAVDPSLPVDLETIIRTATAEEPARRYQSVAELVGDVQRFLSDLPITARRPTKWYEWAKFAQRNKGLLATVAALVVGLGATTVVTSTALVRAKRAEAEVRAINASNEIINDLLATRSGAALEIRNGLEPRRALAERRLLHGNVAEAEADYAQLVRIARAFFGPKYWYVARLRGEHAACLQQLGRFEEAETQMLESYENLRQEHGQEHPLTIDALKRLIGLYAAWGKPAKVAEWSDRLPAQPPLVSVTGL